MWEDRRWIIANNWEEWRSALEFAATGTFPRATFCWGSYLMRFFSTSSISVQRASGETVSNLWGHLRILYVTTRQRFSGPPGCNSERRHRCVKNRLLDWIGSKEMWKPCTYLFNRWWQLTREGDGSQTHFRAWYRDWGSIEYWLFGFMLYLQWISGNGVTSHLPPLLYDNEFK